jgi:hypothetical protein
MDKIAEIREALEKIDRGDFSEIAGAHGKAGEWLRFLLDELDRLRAEREAHAETTAALERVKADIATVMDQLADAIDERDEALAERDKLIEVLRWYAEADYDHKTMTDYYEDDGEVFYGTELDLDRGQRARDILREVGVTVE